MDNASMPASVIRLQFVKSRVCRELSWAIESMPLSVIQQQSDKFRVRRELSWPTETMPVSVICSQPDKSRLWREVSASNDRKLSFVIHPLESIILNPDST
jgi:hypothetical protein